MCPMPVGPLDSVGLLLVWVLKRKEDTNQHCEREHRQDSLPPNVWMNVWNSFAKGGKSACQVEIQYQESLAWNGEMRINYTELRVLYVYIYINIYLSVIQYSFSHHKSWTDTIAI